MNPPANRADVLQIQTAFVEQGTETAVTVPDGELKIALIEAVYPAAFGLKVDNEAT